MTATLEVTLQDRLVATITNVPGDINVVAIDRDFANDLDAPTLSFRAFRDPITGKYRETIKPTRTRAHPYFSNLLPEGKLRAYLADHAHVNPVRDFPLLRLLGADLPGALVIRTRGESTASDVEAEPLPAREIASGDKIKRFSLAGVQLKFSATGNPQRGLTIPVDGIGGSWIVKLPDPRFIDVPENEYAMMRFARMVGIDVPNVGLVDPTSIAGLPSDIRNLTGKAFYIERFDRLPDGGRVHAEDFAQANMLYPEQKYKYFNFDVLGAQVTEIVGPEAALDLIRRIVFTIGIGNGDMHAKNWSVIYRDGRTASLAPAYDYLSTIVYMPDDDLGMNFADTKRFADVDRNLVARYADRIRMPRKPVLDTVHEMVEKMRDCWPKIGVDIPLSKEHRDRIDAHMNTIPIFRSGPASARR